MKEPLSPKELAALVDAAHALSLEIDLPRLLDRVLQRAQTLTGSQKSSIMLFNPERETLYFAAATGPEAEQVLARFGEQSEQQVPLHGSKAGEVFRTGKSVTTAQLARDPDHFKAVDKQTRSRTESMICVPLTCAGERLGVVQLLNKGRPYTAHDRVLLERFAGIASVAIRNARTIRRLVAQMGLFTARKGEDADALLAELNEPPRREQMTVLFGDLRGFTQLAQISESPEHTGRRATEFLRLLARSALRHDGIVNKFMGDGMLALFRGDDHARRGVQCALDIVDGFRQVKEHWASHMNDDLDFLDVGVGVATGEVTVGTFEIEAGIADFTVIGTPVVRAAYMEQQARGGHRVLVDRLTHLSSAGLATARGPKKIELKKAGQSLGHRFDQYELIPASSAAAARRPARTEDAPAALPRKRHRSTATVFVSYSHKDAKWLRDLRRHLKPYVRDGQMNVWDDRRIAAGSAWREQIESALHQASMAIMLVSSNFLESDFIVDHELSPLLKRAKRQGVRILWIPVSASAVHTTDLPKYQALDPERPLDQFGRGERDALWVRICKDIHARLIES